MKILLTGSSGRIGKAIRARLGCQHRVLGLDRVAAPGSEWVGEIDNVALVRSALAGVDAVIHTAALHAPHVGAIADAEFERINVQATRMLADLAVAAGVRQFVYTSTSALYGAAVESVDSAVWVDEALPPQPRTIYHRSKLAAERQLEQCAAATPLQVTVLRMSRCFPEPAPLMAVYRLHRGIDARDVAEAHALALMPTTQQFRRFIVSGATPFQRGDLLRACVDRGWALPRSIDRVYVPALAREGLGWAPQYGYAEVLRQLDAGSDDVLPPF